MTDRSGVSVVCAIVAMIGPRHIMREGRVRTEEMGATERTIK